MNTKTPDAPTEQYAIARLQKIKRQGLGLTHAARAENGVRPEHAIPGNPPPEVLFNAAPVGVDFPTFVMGRYKRAIGEGKVYRPRRDQVLAIEGVLTATPAFFRPDDPGRAGHYTPQSVSALRERGLQFLKDRYPNKLIRVELQLDEVTPHIQFAFLPIDEKGNWSAKNCTTRRMLSALWTDWAAKMKDLGLRRAIAGSQAKHEPIKRYYAAIHKFGADSVRAAQKLVVRPPELPTPSRVHLIDPAGYIAGVNADLAIWAKRETKRILRLIEPLLAAASDAALTRRRAKQLRLTIEGQAGKIADLGTGLQEKEQRLARLEPVSVAAVAEKIGYGEQLDLAPYRNALSFLEQFEGLDYDQSIGWLSAEFGPEAAAATAADLVRENTFADAKDLKRPQIRTVDELKVLLRKQLSALDADEFRILIAPRGEKLTRFTELPALQMKSKSWSLGDIVSGFIELKKRAVDHEVRFLPISRQYDYLRVDGLKAPVAVAEAGLNPCNIVQVGLGRYEAILRASKPLDTAGAKKAKSALNALHPATVHEVCHRTPVRLAGLQSEDAQAVPAVALLQAEDVDFLARRPQSKGDLRFSVY